MVYDWNILNEDYKNNLIDKILEYNSSFSRGGKDYKIVNKDDYTNPKSIAWIPPMKLPNIQKGVKRVKEAVKNNEAIFIAGDYDVDGVTATAVMYFGIRTLTPNVYWRVPNRKDGYGLSTKIIDEAITKGCSLIITVDNGIATFEAINYAQENGVDVVVTDHHQVQEKPSCEIAIDPYVDDFYPFKSICGCMVAFKFLQELFGANEMMKQVWFHEAFALTAIATIADVMSLQNENRRFICSFLRLMKNKKLNVGVGLESLFRHIKNLDIDNLTATAVAFNVVPFINAIGRLSDANQAVELFLTEDVAVADKISAEMVKCNNLRKKYQNDVKQNLHVDPNSHVIVELLEDVPHGIIGAVAGTVSSLYGKPCYLLAQNNEGSDMLTGSGRAPNYSRFNVGAFVSSNKDICSGGGHSSASGIKITKANLQEFKKRCEKQAEKMLGEAVPLDATKTIMFELNFADITDEIMDELQTLEPFGQGNEEPLFCTRGVYVDSTRICGEFKNTIQMEFIHNGKVMKGICFNDVAEKYLNELEEMKAVDICYKLQYNYWRGNKTIQMLIEDFRPTSKMIEDSIAIEEDDLTDINFW